MLKSLPILFAILATALKADPSCDACSPECLDCRIRGYTRLSPDHFSADCFLEVAASVEGTLVNRKSGLQARPGPCDTIPGSTLVCRRERCSLDNGERCKLIALDTAKCPSYLSSVNSALDSELAGCFTYFPAIQPPTDACPYGYTPVCKAANVPDYIPGFGQNSILEPIVGQAAFKFKDIAPISYEIFPDDTCPPTCRKTIPAPNGATATLVLEACVNPASSILASGWSSVLQANFVCEHNTHQLVVQGLAGCYLVRPNRRASCLRGEVPTGFQPLCYYRIDPKDNDPVSGCHTIAKDGHHGSEGEFLDA